MAEFVQFGQITPEGQKVIDRLEAGIADALKLEEGQNTAALNAMSGPFKHYLVNVKQMGPQSGFTAAQWLNDYRYGAQSVYDLVLAEEKQAQQDQALQQQAAAQTDLAAKFEALEAQLKEALAANAALAADMQALREQAEKPKSKPRKPVSQDAEGQPAPAESDAEGDPEKDA